VRVIRQDVNADCVDVLGGAARSGTEVAGDLALVLLDSTAGLRRVVRSNDVKVDVQTIDAVALIAGLEPDPKPRPPSPVTRFLACFVCLWYC
jgi:hypothetical protein